MNRPLMTLFGVLVLFVFSAAPAAPPITAFARLPTFTDIDISPGGDYFAARYNKDNRYGVRVYRITDDARIEFIYGFTETDELSISWFEWVSGKHLLTSIAFTGKRGGGRGAVKTEERRLVTLDSSKSELFPLFHPKRRELPIQIQDQVVSLLPNDPEHILLQYSESDPAKPSVYRVNVTETKSHKKVMRGRQNIRSWQADHDGDVRIGFGIRTDGTFRLLMREKGNKKWSDFSHRVNVSGQVFEPLEFAADPNEVYVASNHEGDPVGVYAFNLTSDSYGPLLFKHDSVDISAIHVDEETGELMGANFVEDRAETHYIKERPIRAKVRQLQDQLDFYRISTHSVSADGGSAVLKAFGEQDAGQYVLFDTANNQVIRLPTQYSELTGVSLGKSIAVSYDARDGLTIPAYVTLPPGIESIEDARDLPFVINPHGGPRARDLQRFDYEVQLMTSRGYGVLQMNFRGSEGYGQAFVDAGNKEWGQAMQDDITDGVLWLIEQGIADAERIAIVGGSYGGYAALMGVVKTPQLYQCAASFAGVSDLPDLLVRQRRFVGGRHSTRFIGDLWKDRKMLATNSPARRAEDIQVPVLLVHGDLDTVVDIKQSKKMAKRLEKFDKTYKFVELEGGDHHRSSYTNRLRYLTELESFLSSCLN